MNLCLRIIDRYLPTLKKLKNIPAWNTSYKTHKKNFIQNVRTKNLASATEPFIVRWHKNLRLMVFPQDEISQCIYLEGFYEPNQLCFMDFFLKSGMVVADIGAHCGVMSLFAAIKVGASGKVFAFEPSPRELSKLKTNISLNKMHQIHPLPSALAEKPGELRLNIAEAPKTGHNSVLPFIHKTTQLKTTEPVTAMTLDAFFVQEKLSKIDLIKVDVEGFEYQTLLGSSNTLATYQPIIMIEIVGPVSHASNAMKAWNFLMDIGYRLFLYDTATGRLKETLSHPGPDDTDFVACHKSKIDVLSAYLNK